MVELAVGADFGKRAALQKRAQRKAGVVSAPAIDREHLARYTFGDLEIEREVLALYCEQVSQLMDQLRQAQDRSAWCFATHSIKGAARAVGAWQVAAIAEQLEAVTWDAPKAQITVASLAAALGESIVAAREI